MRRVARVDASAARWAAASVLASLAGFVALLAFLLVLAGVVDGAFRDGADLAEVAPRLVVLAALALGRAAAVWGSRRVAEVASHRLRRTLRHRVLASVLARPGPPASSAPVIAALGDEIDAMGPWTSSFVPAVVMATVGPLIVFLAILVLDPLTTLVLLFAGPMLILLLAVIGRRTRTLTAQRLEELGWLNAFFLDLLRGVGTLTAFNRESDAADRIEEVSAQHGVTTMEVLRTAFQTSLVMEWAATAATALVAVEVSFRLVGGSLSYGTALAVLVLTPEFFVPLRRLALEYHAGQTGDAAWRSLSRLGVTAPPSSSPSPAPVGRTAGAPVTGVRRWDRPSAPPRIEVAGVVHTHPGADTPALRGVDLAVDPGETLALVGPSGGGKTTLAALLVGLGIADQGWVAVDGHPLGFDDLRGWRKSVSWVPQHPVALAGTIADNIRLGRPDATDRDVRAAARAAGAEAFVDSLPLGFDTPLGEEALRLSGGQRQRLAAARAALRDAPFVVLDEFTAHLDPGTEAEVVAGMRRVLAGRTAVVIAHRLSTALLADRIAVMDAGRVVAAGSHHDLLRQCDTYRRIVEGTVGAGAP
jgi:ATP-binding cassette, subfamily C, bacterial CydD